MYKRQVYGEDDEGKMIELDATKVLRIPRKIRDVYKRQIVDITMKYLGNQIDEDSLAYSRYIIHLKFFLSRIVSHQTSNGSIEATNIFGQLVTKYEGVDRCIQEISEFINEKFDYRCTDEDCIYLMIHIAVSYTHLDVYKRQS